MHRSLPLAGNVVERVQVENLQWPTHSAVSYSIQPLKYKGQDLTLRILIASSDLILQIKKSYNGGAHLRAMYYRKTLNLDHFRKRPAYGAPELSRIKLSFQNFISQPERSRRLESK